MSVRVRYAPSPTGFLHIGNARTALFNYLFAKKYDGKFIIRIEDTDIARNVEGGEASQLNYLKWMGIEWDESIDVGGEYGPYRQLERLDSYQHYANILLEKGLAYKCYCTPDELSESRDDLMDEGVSNIHYNKRCLHASREELLELEKRGGYSIRFKVPENTTYQFNDIVRGELKFESHDIGDWVIIKANGIPTYNFAVVIDDYLMKITHVLRGEEHVTNTPKQLMIFDAFGWEAPVFCHMTLIVNQNRKKLSKRDKTITQFIHQYAEMGYLPEAMFNFIGLLGFSPKGEEEILSKAQFIEAFDKSRLSKSPATFDPDKLKFINKTYMKLLTDEQFKELVIPHLQRANITGTEDWMNKICSVFRERISYGAEIVSQYHEFFRDDFKLGDEEKQFLAQDGVNTTLKSLYSIFETIENWNDEIISSAIKEAGKLANIKGKMLFMPCRIATTGEMHGPDLPKSLMILGKEKTLMRIKSLL
jgi:nondiscriminating glutamyl-tRNA synthetase